MSGFSPEWLALREPADLAARAPTILGRLEQAFADAENCAVVDLGAGTGASVRAFAGLLPAWQHWILVDYDKANLAAAETELAAWADEVVESEGDLQLRHSGRSLCVDTRSADLSTLVDGVAPWAGESLDLVTASALLDLTSARWIEAFAASVSAKRAAVLVTLNFDGALSFAPAQPDDEVIRTAFCEHQRRDKGFGPAAGPDATKLLTHALRAHGYRVETADSPWRLGENGGELITQLIEGVVRAVGETNRLAPQRLAAWRQVRMTEPCDLIVGHQDLIAFPQ